MNGPMEIVIIIRVEFLFSIVYVSLVMITDHVIHCHRQTKSKEEREIDRKPNNQKVKSNLENFKFGTRFEITF